MNDIISVLSVAGGKIVKYSIKIFDNTKNIMAQYWLANGPSLLKISGDWKLKTKIIPGDEKYATK